ncbi:Avirulence (Avh) protein, partial [Phytophthora megakarya]
MDLSYVVNLLFVAILFIVQIDTSACESKTDVPETRMRRGKFDEERGGLSVPFQEKIKAMFSFSKLTAEKRQEKLQGWLRKEKSADIVFTRLQLDKAEEYFFSKPEFATWIQYTDNLSAKNPKLRLSAILTLTTLHGDDALYKILTNARLSPEWKDLATKLQTEQLQYWVCYSVFREVPPQEQPI